MRFKENSPPEVIAKESDSNLQGAIEDPEELLKRYHDKEDWTTVDGSRHGEFMLSDTAASDLINTIEEPDLQGWQIKKTVTKSGAANNEKARLREENNRLRERIRELEEQLEKWGETTPPEQEEVMRVAKMTAGSSVVFLLTLGAAIYQGMVPIWIGGFLVALTVGIIVFTTFLGIQIAQSNE